VPELSGSKNLKWQRNNLEGTRKGFV